MRQVYLSDCLAIRGAGRFVGIVFVDGTCLKNAFDQLVHHGVFGLTGRFAGTLWMMKSPPPNGKAVNAADVRPPLVET